MPRRPRPGLALAAGLILAVLWVSASAAQDGPVLRFEGRVTHVGPREMLVAVDNGPVVMLDVARIPQGEIRRIAQSDYVTVVGFVRRPSHTIIATSVERASPWLPTTPGWASGAPSGP